MENADGREQLRRALERLSELITQTQKEVGALDGLTGADVETAVQSLRMNLRHAEVNLASLRYRLRR